MRILFIDDHPAMHRTIRDTLHLIDASFVVSCVSTLEEGMALVTQDHFDFVLADLRLGAAKNGGFEIVAECTKRGIRSAILSGDCDAELVAEAAKCGASAYIPKTYPLELLAPLIGLVLKFKFTHAPLFAGLPKNESLLDRIPLESRSILTLVCEDKSSKMIAKILGISDDAVKRKLQVCFALLGVKDRGEAKQIYLRLMADAQSAE